MMSKRDKESYKAAREFSDNQDRRMSFLVGVRWADKHPNSISLGVLQNWYQDSIDETIEPIWTNKHIDELFNDFYLIPKEK